MFLFLWFFKPFIVNEEEQKVSYFIICLIHSILPATIALVFFLALDAALIDAKKETWTIGREMLFLSSLFLLIGIGSFLVRDVIYTNPDNWSWRYFSEEIKNTFLAGSLVASHAVLLNFYRLSAAHKKSAESIESHLHPVTDQASEKLSIKTGVKSDDFMVDPEEILFARADGNYVEVFCQIQGTIKKELKRITLSQLETQLSNRPFIFRCHRAFLINIHHIQKVSGNAQGYLLAVAGHPESIPVSRNKLAAFDQLFK